MKTTLVLSDDLVDRAKKIQRRDAVSFKTLVKEGLRLALEKRDSASSQFRFQPVSGGESWLTEDTQRQVGLAFVLREVNEDSATHLRF